MNTSHTSQILMFGIESSMVRSLLDFIFNEELCMEQEKLELFFGTASKLKIDGFMETAQTEMKQSDEKPLINDLCQESKDDLKQDDHSTIDELDTFKPEEFNTDHITHKDPQFQPVGPVGVELFKPLYHDKDDTLTERDNPERVKRKTTRVEVDEEIVYENKGISCFSCRAMEISDHDKFLTMEELHQHEKEKHMRDRSAIYNCEQCGQEFYKLVNFNQHKRKEHPENPVIGKVSCDVCGRSFKNKPAMEKHRDYSHPVPGKVFKCKMPNCKKESLTKNASNVHYYQSHSEKQRKMFEGKL